MLEYDLQGFAKILKVPEERMEKILDDLIQRNMVKKNGEMYSLTEMGKDFIKFISPPEGF